MADNENDVIGTFENDEGYEVQDNPQEDTPVDNDDSDGGDEPVSQNPKVDYVTNFLYEKDGNVYGMEVLIYGRNSESADDTSSLIDRLVVVNESEFDSWTTMIEELSSAYVPYTEEDLNNLQLIREKKEAYDKGQIAWDDYQEYIEDLEWSDLKHLGSLKKILENNETGFTVDINANTLNGFSSEEFSKINHNHNYAPINHTNIEGTYGVGTDTVYGHVKVINSLDSSEENAGETLSAYQGKILNDKIDDVNRKFAWSALTRVPNNDYLRYKVNHDLRLIVCYYYRTNYTGFKNRIGHIVMHSANTIPSEYQPISRVLTTLYRGDVTLYYAPDGSVNIYSLSRFEKLGINAQVMWHY